jgi:hypothetical protein
MRASISSRAIARLMCVTEISVMPRASIAISP